MWEGRPDTTTTRGKLDFCESEKKGKYSEREEREREGERKDGGRGQSERERESERVHCTYTISLGQLVTLPCTIIPENRSTLKTSPTRF